MTGRKTHSEIVREGQARAIAMGRSLGPHLKVSDAQIKAVEHLSLTEGARTVGLSRAHFTARRRKLRELEEQDGR